MTVVATLVDTRLLLAALRVPYKAPGDLGSTWPSCAFTWFAHHEESRSVQEVQLALRVCLEHGSSGPRDLTRGPDDFEHLPETPSPVAHDLQAPSTAHENSASIPHPPTFGPQVPRVQTSSPSRPYTPRVGRSCHQAPHRLLKSLRNPYAPAGSFPLHSIGQSRRRVPGVLQEPWQSLSPPPVSQPSPLHTRALQLLQSVRRYFPFSPFSRSS